METVFVIVNPTAGNGSTARRWAAARSVFHDARIPLRENLTQGPGHATALAKDAGEKGFGTVLVVGGDGTTNEAANGILRLPPSDRPALALLPGGTGADLPRGLGLAGGAEAAVDRLLQPRRLAVDVLTAEFSNQDGKRTERSFVNMADAGIGGAVAARVNGRSKALGGFVSFLTAIVGVFWAYEKPDLAVSVDGVTVREGPTTSVVVANGRYFAGGMRMAPQASFTDGVLDVIIIADVTRRDLVLALPRLYRGTHLDHPRISTFRGHRVSVEGHALLQLDGEHPGWSPLAIHVDPAALEILI